MYDINIKTVFGLLVTGAAISLASAAVGFIAGVLV